jgi:hypothetical protein
LKKIIGTICACLLLFVGVGPARADAINPFDILSAVVATPEEIAAVDVGAAAALAEQFSATSEPVAYVNSLKHSELVALKSYVFPGATSVQSLAASQRQVRAYPTGCWNPAQTLTAYNLLGLPLYSLTLKSNFCTAAGVLKSVTYQGMYPAIYAWGWSADGVLNSGTVKTTRSGMAYGQFKFTYNVAGWALTTDVPCQRNLVYFDGSWAYDSVCGP